MRIENFDESHLTLDVEGKSPEVCAEELFEMVVNSEKVFFGRIKLSFM